jgi:ribose transport system permease protein
MPDALDQVEPAAVGAEAGRSLAASAEAPTRLPAPARPPSRRRWLLIASEYGMVAIGLLIVLVGIVAAPGFATAENLTTIARSAAYVGIVALGMSFVVISGNYADLSVASQVGIAAVCAIALQSHGLLFALLAAFAGCMTIGLLNGLLVGVVRANAVVVTLGSGTLALAILNEATQGALYSGRSAGFARVTGATAGPVPLAFFAFLALAVVAYLLLNRHTYGRRLRAVGSNAAAARIGGVPCGAVVVGAFVITSVCCAISGILLGGFSNSANPTIAQTFVFDALAAIIVGGNRLTGGRGGALQTVTGVLIIAVISDLLVLKGLSFEWNQLLTGAVIVAAVALDAGLRRLAAR